MSIWLSIALILLCLLIILFIILKKFPALAILDVKEMPGEKEAEFKERIIRQRLERDLAKFSKVFLTAWRVISRFFNNFLINNYQRLKKLKADYDQKKKISVNDKQEKINKLFLSAQVARKQEDWEEAEEKLIAIVSLDTRNLLAFFELAELYYDLKKFSEAKATWEHSLKLYQQLKDDPSKLAQVNVQEIRYCLAETCQQMNDLSNAIEYINQALDFEPNNPRFLDLIFDLSIMKKDKKLAQEYFERLVAVNPANQKLIELKDKIKELETATDQDN